VTEDASERLSQKFDRIAPRWSTIVNEQVSHDYHHAFRSIQNVFFLQHYGLPSTVLDITKSLDVALFFAQNRVSGNRFEPVDEDSNPVVYVFLLVPQLDMFVDSGPLCEHYQLLRPLRQQCGLLAGASVLTRNDYSKFVAFKLRIRRRITDVEVTKQYLMPPLSDDTFLAKLVGILQ
jgi:hypothetical protein